VSNGYKKYYPEKPRLVLLLYIHVSSIILRHILVFRQYLRVMVKSIICPVQEY
jgi:hypothetical protein